MTGIPLLFLDCETTGLRPDRHTPWEVAWTTAIHDPERKTLTSVGNRVFCLTLTQADYVAANPVALKVGRFEERFALDVHPVPPAVMTMWLQQDCANIAPDGVPHLVGAVPSFDHNMLCMNHLGWPDFGEGLWHYHLICVEVLAAGKLGIPPPYTSSELTSALGVTVNEDTKHTAEGDVEWAMKMYASVYNLEMEDA